MSMATLAVALVALLMASVLGWNAGRSALDDKVRDGVVSIRIDRAHHVEDYFASLRSLLESLGESPATTSAAAQLSTGFDELESAVPSGDQSDVSASLRSYYEEVFLPQLAANAGSDPAIERYLPEQAVVQRLQELYISDNPAAVGEKDALADGGDGSAYSAHHAEFHEGFRAVVQGFELYDLFLIDPELRIVYSVFKEADFGTDLTDGPYAQSQLGAVARAIRADPVPGEVTITDFATYDPSYGAPAGFLATPLFDDELEYVGTVAIQIPIDEIGAVMTADQRWEEVGMGETGEVYLVGSDRRMRSESRHFIEDRSQWNDFEGAEMESIRRLGSTVLFQPVATEQVIEAFRPDEGVRISTNYLGEEVISAYAPVNVPGLDWAIIAEISTDEAFASGAEYRRLVIITAVSLAALVTFLAVALAERFVQPYLSITSRARSLLNPDHDAVTEPVRFGAPGEAVEHLGTRLDDLRQRQRNATLSHQRHLDRLLPSALARQAVHGDTESIDRFSSLTVVSVGIEGLDAEEWDSFISEVERSAKTNDLEVVSIDGRRVVAACGLRQGHLDQIDRAIRFAARVISVGGGSSRAGIATGAAAYGFVGAGIARCDLWGVAPHQASVRMLAAEDARICIDEDVLQRLGTKTVGGLPDGMLQTFEVLNVDDVVVDDVDVDSAELSSEEAQLDGVT